MFRYFIIILNVIFTQALLSSEVEGFSFLLNNNSLSKPLNANSFYDVINIGDTIWAISSKGIHISKDYGKTWNNISFNDKSISAIGYNKYNKTVWLAFANNVDINGQKLPNGLGLAYSTNYGQNWNYLAQPKDDNKDSLEFYGANKIRALPITTTINNLVYDIAFSKNTVWIASFAGGLRKSTDNGLTWKRVVIPPDYIDTISPTKTYNFTLSPSAGKLGLENNLNHRVFSVASLDDSIIFVGTAGGINVSFDNGKTWYKTTSTNKINGISGNFVTSVYPDTVNKIIFIASWKAEGQNEYTALSFSKNLGESWNIVFRDNKFYNFANAGSDIVAVSDNGVFRSKNGFNWDKLNYFTDSQNKLYTFDNKYYAVASIIKGDSIDIFFAGNNNLVKIREANNNLFWDGYWKIYFASEENFNVNSTYAYPNPFSPSIDGLCKIKYSTGGQNKKVTIRVFSFDMLPVRTIIQNLERGIGEHNISNNEVIDYWDGKNDEGNYVENGVYFYRIDIEGFKPLFGKIMVVK